MRTGLPSGPTLSYAQGYTLGPILFTIYYTLPLGDILFQYNMEYYLYANDIPNTSIIISNEDYQVSSIDIHFQQYIHRQWYVVIMTVSICIWVWWNFTAISKHRIKYPIKFENEHLPTVTYLVV